MTTVPPHVQDDNTPLKRCSNPDCKNPWLPATTEYFYPAKTRVYELRSRCRECTRRERREYLARPEVKQHKAEQHKEYMARPEIKANRQEYNKEYYARLEVIQHRQEYYARSEIIQREKDNKKAYHARPDIKARIGAYYARPEIIQRLKAWGKEHRTRPEIIQHRLEWTKEYRTRPETKEHDRINAHKRRSRLQSIGGTHTYEQINDQLKRQRHKCYYCGTKFKRSKGRYIYQIDHTFPISRVAGTDIPANDISYLVLACRFCNQSKGDKFPWEWSEGGRLL